MEETRTFASLSPTLLARKGGARPAMRPHGAMVNDALARQLDDPGHLDDLGWNDMGDDNDEFLAPRPTLKLTPSPMPIAVPAEEMGEVVALVAEPAPVEVPVVPEVVRQQRTITRRLAAQERRSALADGRRAAFTLRVDSERHLKLRLACALRNRSAQQLVTEALDRLLAELTDVADLAAQVAKKHK